MKVYKQSSFLIFELDDGSTVKYDFATKAAFGKKGGRVMDLKHQLRGITLNDICESCLDPNYARFLRFVRNAESRSQYTITNIGTVLSRVPFYSKYEQIFSAGILRADTHIHYAFKDIPTGLIKLCRTHDIRLTEKLIRNYRLMPDVFNLAFSVDFLSLEKDDIVAILTAEHSVRVQGPLGWRYKEMNHLNDLVQERGYQAKALLLYMDRLKTFEALTDYQKIIKEISDYASMMSKIGARYDRYPRHFLTSHAIACRTFNRINRQFDESKFLSGVQLDMQRTIGDYVFIYPSTTQDIKDEAIQQHNCVADYIDDVVNGQCHIIFMRKKDNPDKSLVTCEVRKNKIVQALQSYNDPLTHEQEIAVDKWNKWYSVKKQEEEKCQTSQKTAS